MLTAGAIVVASFASVSTLVQLTRSVESRTRARLQRGDEKQGGQLFEPDAVVVRKFRHDRYIAFWYESTAALLFGGNGILWLVASSTRFGDDCPSELPQTTSTVAILSALAFAGALGRYFLSCSIVLLAAAALVLVKNWNYRTHVCGAIPYSIAITVCIIVSVRVIHLLHGHSPFLAGGELGGVFRGSRAKLI